MDAQADPCLLRHRNDLVEKGIEVALQALGTDLVKLCYGDLDASRSYEPSPRADQR